MKIDKYKTFILITFIRCIFCKNNGEEEDSLNGSDNMANTRPGPKDHLPMEGRLSDRVLLERCGMAMYEGFRAIAEKLDKILEVSLLLQTIALENAGEAVEGGESSPRVSIGSLEGTSRSFLKKDDVREDGVRRKPIFDEQRSGIKQQGVLSPLWDSDQAEDILLSPEDSDGVMDRLHPEDVISPGEGTSTALGIGGTPFGPLYDECIYETVGYYVYTLKESYHSDIKRLEQRMKEIEEKLLKKIRRTPVEKKFLKTLYHDYKQQKEMYENRMRNLNNIDLFDVKRECDKQANAFMQETPGGKIDIDKLEEWVIGIINKERDRGIIDKEVEKKKIQKKRPVSGKLVAGRVIPDRFITQDGRIAGSQRYPGTRRDETRRGIMPDRRGLRSYADAFIPDSRLGFREKVGKFIKGEEKGRRKESGETISNRTSLDLAEDIRGALCLDSLESMTNVQIKELIIMVEHS